MTTTPSHNPYEYRAPARADVRSRPWFVQEVRVGLQPFGETTGWFCKSVEYTPCGVVLANVRAQNGPMRVNQVRALLLPPPGHLETFTIIYDGPADSLAAPEPEDY